jgi:hypothetical protein
MPRDPELALFIYFSDMCSLQTFCLSESRPIRQMAWSKNRRICHKKKCCSVYIVEVPKGSCVTIKGPHIAYMHTYIHAYMHTCIHAHMHTCILNSFRSLTLLRFLSTGFDLPKTTLDKLLKFIILLCKAPHFDLM